MHCCKTFVSEFSRDRKRWFSYMLVWYFQEIENCDFSYNIPIKKSD